MTTEHEHLLNVFESRVALIKNTLNSGLTFNLIKIERMKPYLNLAYLSKDWMVDGRTREREEVKVSKHSRLFLCQPFNIFQGEYWIVFM